MNKQNTYLNLCTQVYDLSKPHPPEDAYAFYHSYTIEANGPILEPMCGTGRFLLTLLAQGFDIDGFDASEHMLEALKTRSGDLKPNIWQGFAEDLAVAKKYNLIFIPCGSFGLITDLEIAKLALKKFYDHLNVDGILLFEGETLKSLPALGVWRGSSWHKEDGSFIIANYVANLVNDICVCTQKYELVKNNRIISTEVEEMKIRLYDDPEVLIALLKEVGFKEIKLIKAFDRAMVPGKDDEVIIYECRK